MNAAWARRDSETLRVEKLASREAERTTRLLASRQRTIGIDVAGLDEGVYLKQVHKEEEKKAEHQHALALTSAVAAASSLAAEAKQGERARTADTVRYWDMSKDKSLRKEWDLSDPTQTARATLPRDLRPLYETGLHAPASSMQTFAGELLEDPSIPKRKAELLLTGFEEAVVEKAAREAEESRKFQTFATMANVLAATGEAIAAEESEQRLKRKDATAEGNRVLAGTHHARAVHEKQVSKQASAAELVAVDANPMLREDCSLTVNVLAPDRRYRPDHFKGYSKDERAAILAVVGEQLQEKEVAAASAAAERKAFDRGALELLAAGEAQDAAIAQKQKQQKMLYYEGLRQDAEARKAREAVELQQRKAPQLPASTGLLAGFGKSLR